MDAAADADATLPEEMIVQIVSRLPVKSVGRCRCVSTRWCALFSDPRFAKSHFQVSPKHQSLIFRIQNDLKTPDSNLCNTASLEKESLVLRDLNAPFDHTGLEFLGSCNGLVATCDQTKELVIWNPATRFLKRLPRLPIRSHPPSEYQSSLFGFGFGCVPGSDEYKLTMGGEIFSSRTDTWKPRREIPLGVYWLANLRGILCEGALHWPFCPKDPKGNHLLVFDLEKEELSVMLLPDALQSGDIHQLGLTCEGNLYVMVGRGVPGSGDMMVEFWVMRMYGNRDSWTRSIHLKIPRPGNGLQLSFAKAILVMETGAFVMNKPPTKFAWVIRGPGEDSDEEDHVSTTNLMSTTYYHNEEENKGICVIDSDYSYPVVEYEESLYCLN